MSLGREKDYQLFLQCEPALILTLPNEAFSYAHYTEEGGKIKGEFRSVRNKGGDVAFWRVKSALSLGIDQLAFFLGLYDFQSGPLFRSKKCMFRWTQD